MEEILVNNPETMKHPEQHSNDVIIDHHSDDNDNDQTNDHNKSNGQKMKKTKKTIITITKIHNNNNKSNTNQTNIVKQIHKYQINDNKTNSNKHHYNGDNHNKHQTSTTIDGDDDDGDGDDVSSAENANVYDDNDDGIIDDHVDHADNHDDDHEKVVDNDTFNQLKQHNGHDDDNNTTNHQISSTSIMVANKLKQHRPTMMIDDLFVRKLLHQICPKHFDETWLQRFKAQYLNSFLDSSVDGQRKRLETILSTNELTCQDEIFVYWRFPTKETNESETEEQDDDFESSTWLQQNRDPMSYLYNFCELLMFMETKIVECSANNDQLKELCRQLAREIRAYLFWLTNDERFQEDSQEQEQLKQAMLINGRIGSITDQSKTLSDVSEEKNVTTSNIDDNQINNDGSGHEQQLFYSIVQHLLIICHEMIFLLSMADGEQLTTKPTIDEESLQEQNRLKFFQIFFNLLSNSKFQQTSVDSREDSKTSHSTLYGQWMRNLNQILLKLFQQRSNQPKSPTIKNQQQEVIDNEEVMLKITPLGGGDYFHNQQQQETVDSSSNITNSYQVLVSSFNNNTNNNPTTVGVAIQQHRQTPPITVTNSHQQLPTTSSSTTTIVPGQRSSSSAASSVNSGPSSGIGSSLDSSNPLQILSSSSTISSSVGTYRDIFSANTTTTATSSPSSRFLPLSAASQSSMTTPSPTPMANFNSNATGTGTVDDNSNQRDQCLSMLSILNNCHLVDDLSAVMAGASSDDDCCLLDGPMPKLIAPPSSTQQHKLVQHQPPNHSNSNNNNQFGFDFNSTLNSNSNQQQTPNSNNSVNGGFFSSNSILDDCHQNGGGGGNSIVANGGVTTSNGGAGNSFFNEFNIQSLFSSFDDNVSQVTGESGTITDFSSTGANPHHILQNHPSAVIKHYPPQDEILDPSNDRSSSSMHHQQPLPVNQCFTMTLDSNQPLNLSIGGNHPSQQNPHNSTAAQNCFQQPTKSMVGPANRSSTTLTTPPLVPQQQSQQQLCLQGTNSNVQSPLVVDNEMLCERQTLYRLIISQLLFDGHRNIACQVALAEHIKCDSFLIGPSQELHKLVTFAKAKKKEDILMDKSAMDSHSHSIQQQTNNSFSRTASAASFFDTIGSGSPQTSPAAHNQQHLSHHLAAHHPHHHQSQQTSPLPHHPSLRLDDVSNTNNSQHQKGIFDHLNSGSHPLGSMGLFTNGGLNSSVSSVTSQSGQNSASILDYTDLNSSATDLYSPSSGPLDYYFSRSPEIQQSSNNQQLFTKLISGGRSPGGSQSVTSGGNELILTEAGLKNLNQLAKLNSATNAANVDSSLSSVNPLLGTGPAAAAAAMMFGRSASAMAMTSLNGGSNQAPSGANSSSSSQNAISRSPLTIKSPTNHPATHTTGNGKTHQIMQIVYKFGSLGQLKSQFSSPHGFCLGMNDEIIIADTNNHRICVYDKNGVWKQMFGNPGKDEGQLWYPRKITMIPPDYVRNTVNSPYYVICDRGMERSRMQIFTRNGNFVRKIPIRYIDIVAGIAINSRGHIVVVDSVSPTIYVITIDNGTLIEWRDCGDYMREPSDVAIYDDDYYICDFKGHCVVVINAQGEFIRKIGMEGLTSFPNGIDISPAGDIFVGDSHGNKFHVVVFNRDGRLLAEYECPYCKVSRCCGLKLTKDNNIVTLAKNNHHVLVLNPNFQQNQQQSQQGQITAASTVAAVTTSPQQQQQQTMALNEKMN